MFEDALVIMALLFLGEYGCEEGNQMESTPLLVSNILFFLEPQRVVFCWFHVPKTN